MPVYPTTPGLGFNSEKALERRVEFCLKQKFGGLLDDVDVDVDFRRRRVEVEVELEDLRFASTLRAFVLTLPELQGFRIKLDIDD